MRHGRSKAARKTLRYFERTVNLKSKPYYSVLLDATFLTAMIRITTNTSNSNTPTSTSNSHHRQNDSSDEIALRIERVLQVGGGTGSHHHDSHHDRDNDHSNHHHNYDDNNNNTTTGFTTRYNVRYFIPQEAVTELELIVASLKEKSTLTKKKKKCQEYLQKAQLFIDALAWIDRNSCSKKQKNAYHKEQRLNNQNQAAHYHGGPTNSTGGNSSFGTFSRCEILPKFPHIGMNKQNKKKSTSSSIEKGNKNIDEDEEEETETIVDVGITAADAVRRHIAQDDIDTDNDATTTTTGSTQQQKRQQRTYIVGTQEDDLLDELRSLGTVPIIRLANKASVLIVENPSKKGQRSDYGNEQQKWFGNTLGETEKAMVDAAWKLKRKEEKETTTTTAATGSGSSTGRGGGSGGSNSNHKQKQRGAGGNKAKGPNPLSCKRKRSDGGGNIGGNGNGNSNDNNKMSNSSSSSKKRRERGQRKKEKELVLLE